MASKNQDNWPIFQPLLAETGLTPTAEHIQAAVDHFHEVLAIRKSSRLFRLPTGTAVNERLSFLAEGPGHPPGVIAMLLADDDGAFDRRRELLLVVFNANSEAQTVTFEALEGAPLTLHEVQQSSSDPLVRSSSFDSATGTLAVPPRTTSVFQWLRAPTDRLELLSADVDALEASGELRSPQARALRARIDVAHRFLDRGLDRLAARALRGVDRQLSRLIRQGRLAPESGEPLVEEVRGLIWDLR